MSNPAISSRHVERVIPVGEPADGYGPVEADLTGFDCFFNIRELFEVFGGGTRSRAVSGATSRRPRTHSPNDPHPAPIGTCLRSTSRNRIICAALAPGDHRLTIKQLLLDLVVGGGLDIHTTNVSRASDRNA